MTAEDGSQFGGGFGFLQAADAIALFGAQGAGIHEDRFQLIGGEFTGTILIHVDDFAGRDINATDRDRYIDRLPLFKIFRVVFPKVTMFLSTTLTATWIGLGVD